MCLLKMKTLKLKRVNKIKKDEIYENVQKLSIIFTKI